MTEDEARKRWCPFARIAGWPYLQSGDRLEKLGGVAAINRDTDTDEIAEGTHCLASNCMAWRWTSPPHWRVQVVPGRTQAATKDEEGAYQTRGNGYCGIAGKPETP